MSNKSSLLSTRLAEQAAAAKVGEVKAAGLPQLNLAANVADNLKLQKSLVDFSKLSGPTLKGATLTQADLASAQAGQSVTLQPSYADAVALPPQAFAFGLQYAGNTSLSLSQVLFDGAYLIGLKAAKVYTDLAKKQNPTSRD